MFGKKQDVAVRTDAVIKGKDVKQFRAQLSAVLGVDDESLASLVPNKASCRRIKLVSKNSVIALEEEGREIPLPLAFYTDRVESEATIVPTVFALWHLPWTMPCLVTHEHVCERILDGADLFWPGVVVPAGGFPEFPAGTKVVIRIRGNPAPFAVGIATQSAAAAAAGGFTGEAVKVLHVYRDCLWEMGGRIVPNDGFQQRRVVAMCEEEIVEAGDAADSTVTEASPAVDTPPAPPFDDPKDEDGRDLHDPIAAEDGIAATEVCVDDVVDMAGVDSTESATSPDDVLMTAFLEALKVHVKTGDLPMLANVLIARYVLPNRVAGTTVNIKATQWKSFSAFLKAMAADNLLDLSETKDVLKVENVVRKHPLLSSYVPHNNPAVPADVEADASGPEVSMSTVYEPKGGMATLFEWVEDELIKEDSHRQALGIPVRGKHGSKVVYRKEAARRIVSDYIAMQKMTAPDKPSEIVLNPLLTDALFPSMPPSGYPARLPKEQVFAKLFQVLQTVSVIQKANGDVEVVSGSAQPITVTVAKLKGREKYMTTVARLQAFGISLPKVAMELQKLCAASSTIVDPDTDHATVAVQGSFPDAVARHLMENYGIPKSLVKCVSAGGRKSGK